MQRTQADVSIIPSPSARESRGRGQRNAIRPRLDIANHRPKPLAVIRTNQAPMIIARFAFWRSFQSP
jgi:hypothetical protein